MKKLTTTIIAFILALALTACDKTATSPETSSPTTPPPTDTTSSAGSETSAISDTEEINEKIILDFYGIKVDISEYEKSENGFYGSFDDYTFARKPTGVCFNSVDNPDFYDPETMELKVDYPDSNPIEKVKVGDKFGSLTVKETEFNFQGGVNSDKSSWNEYGSIIAYEGNITLKGYISAAATSDTLYITVGDIFFQPDSDSLKDIPIPVCSDSNSSWFKQLNDDLIIYTDCFAIRLGSLLDEKYAKSDLSVIPADGTAKYVEVTLTDLYFDINEQFNTLTATIVDFN